MTTRCLVEAGGDDVLPQSAIVLDNPADLVQLVCVWQIVGPDARPVELDETGDERLGKIVDGLRGGLDEPDERPRVEPLVGRPFEDLGGCAVVNPELSSDDLGEAVEHVGSVAGNARVDDELVFVDEVELGLGEVVGGDRVVVLRDGFVEQVGTPREIYERPANLFVAGFIGSPAMNFFPASLTDGGIKLPFGEVMLSDEAQRVLEQHPAPRNVIAGIRPEHFDDAALIDTYSRIRAVTFEVDVDLVESLGADKYLYFRTEGSGAKSAQLEQLAAESGTGENEFVARVSADSKVRAGGKAELAVDTAKLLIFDADSGVNLSIPPVG